MTSVKRTRNLYEHFYLFPKQLFSEEWNERLGLGAKILYALMINRLRLCEKRGWYDEEDKPYIEYPSKLILKELGVSSFSTVSAYLKQLSSENLIRIVRTGNGGNNRIYVQPLTKPINDEKGTRNRKYIIAVKTKT